MYDDQYGLTGRPFQLTPDPKFWFDSATHKKAMAYLGYGLSQGEGFIVVTGEPGTGKTMLVGHLLESLDHDEVNAIQIVSTQIGAEDLLRLVAEGLGVATSQMAKATMLAAIERGLHGAARAGKRTLLIVDEAQALPIDSLEELRMLSNFQAGGHPLMQIFLLGQPGFREVLQLKQLEQLRQRVIAMHHLESMAQDEIESYLIHRLSIVGWSGRPCFTNDAIAAMHRWSGGNPRRLNMLAGRTMLYGAIERTDSLAGEDLEAVITDLDQDTPLASVYRHQPLERAGQQKAAPERTMAMNDTDAPDTHERLARIEAQLREQDAAIRRVLTLLVDWVENDRSAADGPVQGGDAS